MHPLLFRVTLAIFLLVSIGGCGLFGKKPEQSKSSLAVSKKVAPNAFLEAEKLIEMKNFKDAISSLEKLKNSNEGATQDYRKLLYRLGEAYEGDLQFEKAISVFKELLNMSLSLGQRDQVEVLYKLVACYEGAGNDGLQLATLKDLEKRRYYLPREYFEFEIPARYAMIYTRLGDLRNADLYYKKFAASVRLEKTKTNSKQISKRTELPQAEKQPVPVSGATPQAELAAPEVSILPSTLSTDSGGQILVPKIMYNIGRLSSRRLTLEELKIGHPALSHAQAFLLQAVQSGDATWAPRSAAELIQIYQDSHDMIASVMPEKTDDPLIGKEQAQQLKKQLAAKILKKVSELRVRRAALQAEGQENPNVTELFERIDSIDNKLSEILTERPVQEELTDESKSREGLKRPGQIIENKKSELPKK